MKITTEQKEIIAAKGNLKINAVAGSGKTTTIIAYAQAQTKTAKLLYIAFNKTVKLEAQKKINNKGIKNVRVETAHSLAYSFIVRNSSYTLKNSFEPYEIAALLGLTGNAQKHSAFIIANHIIKYITFYCNSDAATVDDLNYLETIDDPKAKIFVTTFLPYIQNKTKLLLSKMDESKIPIVHDFYLKKFQLAKPKLNYDFILFDEGQDASMAMLDIFLNQDATKVIVGDTHQQIYGFRHAINSLEKVNFKTYELNTSFRFNQNIANLAIKVLDYKKIYSQVKSLPIKGFATNITTTNTTLKKTKAVVARTNLGLLLKAIEYIIEKKRAVSIYFEGNINSYTYASEGASIYDILSLKNNNKKGIKNPIIAAMKNMEELKEYIKTTEDVQLGMMFEIVERYGNKLPDILKTLKEKHVKDEDKETADIIFSTVHKCKGMEYSEVQLVDDFINDDKIDKLINDNDKKRKLNAKEIKKLNEEINLLYVAVTRCQDKLYVPLNMLPANFKASGNIYVIMPPKEKELVRHNLVVEPPIKTSNNIIKKIIKKDAPKATNKKWTLALDEALTLMYCEGKSIGTISKKLERTPSAINTRIKMLDLYNIYS